MARKSFSDKHEDILIFLEENISKLVKLKVASRATYKSYDDNYMNYLTAESIDDDFRMELYSKLVDECYCSMMRKLQTAINDNADLKKDKVVAEYIELMGIA